MEKYKLKIQLSDITVGILFVISAIAVIELIVKTIVCMVGFEHALLMQIYRYCNVAKIYGIAVSIVIAIIITCINHFKNKK